ncbi:MAG: hypothetical protein HLUCCO16_02410 [Phormidium sp. OSCR]|nr:MAG: hypothetical protein HLUCCO16_02410 [Phormidium sp. OSCR]
MARQLSIVLDTCALIWWSLDPERLSQAVKQACDVMEQEKNGYVPSISIWEIALKVKRKKLDLGVDIQDYVAALKQSDVVKILPINEDIWLKTVQLEWDHRDPADRVVVAIAQMTDSSIITADTKIAQFYSSIIW